MGFFVIALILSFSTGCWRALAHDAPIHSPNQRDSITAFLKWFQENGGIFHNLRQSPNATISLELFPEYGGFGLAVSAPSLSPPADSNCQLEECHSREETPVIGHLEPLFTVPRSLVLSVSRVVDTYASSSENGVSDFYSRVHRALKRAFPGGRGLDGLEEHSQRGNSHGNSHGGTLGLVEQDVVMAVYLMAEDCRHRFPALFVEGAGGSFWGPYLDVLPDYQIPRLDTFDDDDYRLLNDSNLEQQGKSSKQRLRTLYSGLGTSSFRWIARDMIQAKMKPGFQPKDIPQSCTKFDTFHKFVAILSSRAMILKGTKYLTPLAEMINYAPVPAAHQRLRQDWIRPPFDLYHTISENGSITVRSDRDVFMGDASSNASLSPNPTSEQSPQQMTVIQLFEDYGPVDSSLFLEAHGFIPFENPNNCAVISSSLLFLPNTEADADYIQFDQLQLVRDALDQLNLLFNPSDTFDVRNILDDICVKKDLSMYDDGKTIGRRPASDVISITALLLGIADHVGDDLSNPTQCVESTKYSEQTIHDFDRQREKCIHAIETGDDERIELRCARYPGNKKIVRNIIRNAAKHTIRGQDATSPNNDGLDFLAKQLKEVESNGREKAALALRFRIAEREILNVIANSSDGDFENECALDGMTDSSDTITNVATENLEESLSQFRSFIKSLRLPVNKIEPKIAGNGMRIGAFATEPLNEGDIYLAFPPNSVIDTETILSGKTAMSSALERLERAHSFQHDRYDIILMYLLHERFTLGESSTWWPYLNLLPSIEEMSATHPLFFTEDEIDLYLAGSDVRKYILNYQRGVAEEHVVLSSETEIIDILGSDNFLDRKKYLWAHIILDSRTIWWNGKRHLVPLLDLVNADGKPNRAHESKLETLDSDTNVEAVVTRSSSKVQRGEQIFENYWQPNYILYVYHGFLLDENPVDCALLQGVHIRPDDPGAKYISRLRSGAPRFCIGDDIESLQQLAGFLSLKYDLPQTRSDINEEVRPYLIQLLKERISRLEESIGSFHNADVASYKWDTMKRMVERDLSHFQRALQLVV